MFYYNKKDKKTDVATNMSFSPFHTCLVSVFSSQLVSSFASAAPPPHMTSVTPSGSLLMFSQP